MKKIMSVVRFEECFCESWCESWCEFASGLFDVQSGKERQDW